MSGQRHSTPSRPLILLHCPPQMTIKYVVVVLHETISVAICKWLRNLEGGLELGLGLEAGLGLSESREDSPVGVLLLVPLVPDDDEGVGVLVVSLPNPFHSNEYIILSII